MRVKDRLNLLISTNDREEVYTPEQLKLLILTAEQLLKNSTENLEAAEEGLKDAEDPEAAAQKVEEAKAALVEAQGEYDSAVERVKDHSIVFRFRYPSAQAMQEIRDHIAGVRRKWMSKKDVLSAIRDETHLGLERLSDEQLISLQLQRQGIPPDFLDEKNFQTPQQLLAGAIERLQDERDLIESYADFESAVRFDEAVAYLEQDARTASYEDFDDRMMIHLTEQERGEMTDYIKEHTEEEILTMKEQFVRNHLEIERQRREKVLATKRAEILNKGREEWVRELVNLAINGQCDVVVTRRYTAELISEIARIRDGEQDDEAAKWVKAFTVEEAEELPEPASSQLYMWLSNMISQMMPQEVGAVIASATFQQDVVTLPE